MKLEKIFIPLSLTLIIASSLHFGNKMITSSSPLKSPIENNWSHFTMWQQQKNLIVQELLKPYPSELLKIQGYLNITSNWPALKPLKTKEVQELLSYYDMTLSQIIIKLPESQHKASYLKQLRDSEDQIRQLVAKK